MYQLEMDDTIVELETIVSAHKKFGEPERPKPSLPKTAEWPSKITLAWLFQNAPLSLWIWFVSLLIAAFLLGTQVGQSALYKQVREAIAGASDARK